MGGRSERGRGAEDLAKRPDTGCTDIGRLSWRFISERGLRISDIGGGVAGVSGKGSPTAVCSMGSSRLI